MQQRNGIEVTTSELVRQAFRGLLKTRLQAYMIATAVNFKRLVRALNDTRFNTKLFISALLSVVFQQNPA
jgi:hypothetical protein